MTHIRFLRALVLGGTALTGLVGGTTANAQVRAAGSAEDSAPAPAVVAVTAPGDPIFGSLAPGDRVRLLTGSGGKPLVAGVAAVQGDALLLRPSERYGTTTIPAEEIRRLEVSTGIRSLSGRGAVTGGVVLGGTYALIGLLSAIADPWYGMSAGEYVAVVGFAAGLGAGTGAIVGARMHADRWEEVPVRRGEEARSR